MPQKHMLIFPAATMLRRTDVAAVFRDVCAHRLVLNTKARMRGYTETDVADEIVSEHKKPGVKDFKRR